MRLFSLFFTSSHWMFIFWLKDVAHSKGYYLTRFVLCSVFFLLMVLCFHGCWLLCVFQTLLDLFFFNHLHRNMCNECSWGHKTFLVQLYWHLTIKLYLHHDNLAFLYMQVTIYICKLFYYCNCSAFVSQKRV